MCFVSAFGERIPSLAAAFTRGKELQRIHLCKDSGLVFLKTLQRLSKPETCPETRRTVRKSLSETAEVARRRPAGGERAGQPPPKGQAAGPSRAQRRRGRGTGGGGAEPRAAGTPAAPSCAGRAGGGAPCPHRPQHPRPGSAFPGRGRACPAVAGGSALASAQQVTSSAPSGAARAAAARQGRGGGGEGSAALPRLLPGFSRCPPDVLGWLRCCPAQSCRLRRESHGGGFAGSGQPRTKRERLPRFASGPAEKQRLWGVVSRPALLS